MKVKEKDCSPSKQNGWYKLDEEYGDIATFVAEVLVPNKIIQCYKCDPFYNFCS
jgi:hypothetical protein